MDDHHDEYAAWSAFMQSSYVVQQLVPPAPAWMREARCIDADPDVFFPEVGAHPDAAVRVCAACPVIEPCREYGLALDSDDEVLDGVWGGMSKNERKALARQRAA